MPPEQNPTAKSLTATPPKQKLYAGTWWPAEFKASFNAFLKELFTRVKLFVFYSMLGCKTIWQKHPNQTDDLL